MTCRPSLDTSSNSVFSSIAPFYHRLSSEDLSIQQYASQLAVLTTSLYGYVTE